MAKTICNQRKQAGVEVNETTLAKRVLNSNLSDEDKIVLIQTIGNPPASIIYTPSGWTTDSPFLDPIPIYEGHGTGAPKYSKFIITCDTESNACPHAGANCPNGE